MGVEAFTLQVIVSLDNVNCSSCYLAKAGKMPGIKDLISNIRCGVSVRVFFKGTDRVLILDAINQRLRHSKLAGMIAFDLEGDMVLLTIKKLGKSTIYLSSERERDGLLFRVAREDVRAHHQVLRPLVLKVSRFCKVLVVRCDS